MMRHVGKLAQTDTRCVVVMMQIPGREDHALVIESDSLPDIYHQNVMQVLESKEGQSNINFADELGKRQMFIADRGNMSILQALHEAKFLRPISVDSVVMTPTPGNAYPLRKVLEGMGKTVAGEEKSVLDPANDPNNVKFNPHTYNRDINTSEDKLNAAKGILNQAKYVDAEANKLREQAYAMAPELRPEQKVTSTENMQLHEPTNVPVEDVSVDTIAKDSTNTESKKRSRGRPKGSTKAKVASK